MNSSMKWNELSSLGEAGIMHAYIEGGDFGVMGTPGKRDWRVVHAADGVSVADYECYRYEDAMYWAEVFQSKSVS